MTAKNADRFQLWLNHAGGSARWYITQLSQQFVANDCLAAAGALTYTTLFAVVPMITVAYTFFSLLPQYQETFGERVKEFIFTNFVPGSSAAVQDQLTQFADSARNLTWIGFLFLFATVFLTFITIEKRFNVIWHVAEPRRGLQRFLLYWGVLSLGPAALVIGILSTAYVQSLPLVADLDTLGLREIFFSYLPLLISVASFTILYYAVPNCHVPFTHALVGGIVTAVIFQIALIVMGQSSRVFSYDAVYGTFAALPAFLFWLYLVWVIVLSGAIFVRTLGLTRDEESNREPLMIKAARILRLFHEAHLEGQTLTDKDINAVVRLSRIEHERVFDVFTQLKLLNQTEDERWLLGRSLKAVTLWDLYQFLPDELDLQRLESITDMPGVVEPLMAITQFGSNEMSVSLDRVFST